MYSTRYIIGILWAFALLAVDQSLGSSPACYCNKSKSSSVYDHCDSGLASAICCKDQDDTVCKVLSLILLNLLGNGIGAPGDCGVTSRINCYSNAGFPCRTYGFTGNDAACCTTNGVVYFNQTTGLFVYADCPNAGQCATDFSSCQHLCSNGQPVGVDNWESLEYYFQWKISKQLMILINLKCRQGKCVSN